MEEAAGERIFSAGPAAICAFTEGKEGLEGNKFGMAGTTARNKIRWQFSKANCCDSHRHENHYLILTSFMTSKPITKRNMKVMVKCDQSNEEVSVLTGSFG